ncbi:heavy metal sensor histidine kinase [Aquabacterium sp. G14]|uniref:heavy metal sensor histidine kinase n=1 Tax=Aquabacterium sp. G14 TaxID=3130164 RepID=UPI00309C85B4
MLRHLSLTSRLTVFFTIVAATVVLGLGYLLLLATDQHFKELDRTTLEDKQHLIDEILTKSNSLGDARSRLSEALNHHHGLHVLVKVPGGDVIFQTNGFGDLAKDFSADSIQGGHAQPTREHGEGDFHAVHSQSSPGYDQVKRLDVTVAIETAHHQKFLTELQGKLVIYAVIATLISGVLGWIAAHQGMAPLRDMKTRAAGVTGQQLERRMPVEAVPIEMADLARELNQMLGRLQEDFLRLSEFSSDLAHELRTPISNLLTQTQVTLSADRDAPTYRDVLASNAEELQRLARMVSDMLFLAKTERGVDLPNKERFSAAREVQALLEFYDAVADDKRICLSTHGDGQIYGDRLMFRRAVSNLLSNALRHTPKEGVVQIAIVASAKTTEITVENTGQDIDPLVLPRLFDRFYRADPARSHPDSDGTGLGLSITKAIVEAHGGNASARSGGGKTQFTLSFPH